MNICMCVCTCAYTVFVKQFGFCEYMCSCVCMVCGEMWQRGSSGSRSTGRSLRNPLIQPPTEAIIFCTIPWRPPFGRCIAGERSLTTPSEKPLQLLRNPHGHYLPGCLFLGNVHSHQLCPWGWKRHLGPEQKGMEIS